MTPPVPYDEPVATMVRRAVALLAGAESATTPRAPAEDGPVDLPSIYRELASLAEDGTPAAPRGMSA